MIWHWKNGRKNYNTRPAPNSLLTRAKILTNLAKKIRRGSTI
jgi:hypothetical protein